MKNRTFDLRTKKPFNDFKRDFAWELSAISSMDSIATVERILFPSEPPDVYRINGLEHEIKQTEESTNPQLPDGLMAMSFLSSFQSKTNSFCSLPNSTIVWGDNYYSNYVSVVERINAKAKVLGLSDDFIPIEGSSIRVALELFEETLESYNLKSNKNIIMGKFVVLLPGLINYDRMDKIIDIDKKRLNAIINSIKTLIKHHAFNQELYALEEFWFGVFDILTQRTKWKKNMKKYRPFQPGLVNLIQTLNSIKVDGGLRGLIYDIFDDNNLLKRLYAKSYEKYPDEEECVTMIKGEISNLLSVSKSYTEAEIVLSFTHF